MTVVDLNSLFESLESGLLLVTGNNRLARVLSGQYNQWRIARGDRQWPSPDILSWDAWLDRLWEQASLHGADGTERSVPGTLQLLSLWQNVLREDPRAQLLLRPESLAARLRDTRRIAVDWRLDFQHTAWSGEVNENHSAFRDWNHAFEACCRGNGWIAPEDRVAVLCKAAPCLKQGKKNGVGLLGFDEFNPAQQELIDALGESGLAVRQLEMVPAHSHSKLWKSPGAREELQAMARWARHCLETDPGSRIAIVIPDLQSRRQEVERHLAEILMPGRDEHGHHAKPWNISMGTPLARVPMIESAFDALRLLEKHISTQDIGRLLRSPWIKGGVTERNCRALLEKCLRENYPKQLKPGEVRYRAGEVRKYSRDHVELSPEEREPRSWNSPVLAGLLDVLMRFERDSRGDRKPSTWAEALDGLLAKLGWPLFTEGPADDDTLDQDEAWQAWQAWQEALRELASLDATVTTLGRQAAISQLQQLCRERIFQPRTPPAPIQVLGLYEASGLRFDHMWVMGLHNDNWPPAAQPDPFIPGMLQQKARLPHSSPQRELEVARNVTARLLQTAEDIVFSYPGRIDGEEVLSSPLLTGARFQAVGEIPGWQGMDWQTAISLGEPPPIVPLRMPGPPRHGTARGGSSILKHQALCPFRAYAANRLAADGLQTPVEGISPMLHGSLVHRVLELFWSETRTHETLLSLDQASLTARIRCHVDEVINSERGLSDRPAFREVVGRRLERLVAASLELEKSREPFEVIGFEQQILQEIEGQPIRLIMDRIDRLPGGEQVIIDYKTGKVDPGKWFGDRPEDPQLPLYAISAEGTPAAITFFVIRDEECLYRGVVTRDGILPGLPPRASASTAELIGAGQDMPLTIENWRRTLHRLMADFLAGKAAIDPKNGDKTCTGSYCEFQPFCRVTELEQLRETSRAEDAV